MAWLRLLCLATVACVLLVPGALAQAPPKPGPEHELLKQSEGTWDATIKMGPAESKGVSTYKMDLGGLWLFSTFKGEFGGAPFSGRGVDGYDAGKQKYVGAWVDSMDSSLMTSEGTYDKATKTMTMKGQMKGQDGKLATHTMTTVHKDADTMVWTMAGPGPDGKEAVMMTITYKRRK